MEEIKTGGLTSNLITKLKHNEKKSLYYNMQIDFFSKMTLCFGPAFWHESITTSCTDKKHTSAAIKIRFFG